MTSVLGVATDRIRYEAEAFNQSRKISIILLYSKDIKNIRCFQLHSYRFAVSLPHVGDFAF